MRALYLQINVVKHTLAFHLIDPSSFMHGLLVGKSSLPSQKCNLEHGLLTSGVL